MTGSAGPGVLLVGRDDLLELVPLLDPLAAVREVFRRHAEERILIPPEASLYWRTGKGHTARSLNMPGALGGESPIVGTKVINASAGNGSLGIPRASGVTLLFDPETARLLMMVEASIISALRTAAVTLLAVELMGRRPAAVIAILGAGPIGSAHAEMVCTKLEGVAELRLHDTDRARADALAGRLGRSMDRSLDGDVLVFDDALRAVRDADVVITCTTVTRGYIPFSWLSPGTLAVNVSLDDFKEDVIFGADRVVVDSWDLVKDDEHRLLGRLYRQGCLAGPLDPTPRVGRRVDAEIKDVLTDPARGRCSDDDIIVVNPFGLGVVDIAIAHQVYRLARNRGLGQLVAL